MIRIRKGNVRNIIYRENKVSIIRVEYDGMLHDAVNYDDISGEVECGDMVYLNVTANFLRLGTGGYDFVIINATRGENLDIGDNSDIMKMKYSPCQVGYKYNRAGENFKSLNGMPVMVGELHSMLPAAACSIKYLLKHLKIAYIMTDGGSLFIGFSNIAAYLRRRKIIDASITCGNSYGGDFEAVNIFDALAIAYDVIKCDIAIVIMGPGLMGTETKYGFSGIDQGFVIDAVNTLGGVPIFIPRISFADNRERHQGISHHTLTILSEVCKTKARVVIPDLGADKLDRIMRQINNNKLYDKHDMIIIQSDIVFIALKYYNVDVSTMGRNIYEDRDFFISCGCAAQYAASIIK